MASASTLFYSLWAESGSIVRLDENTGVLSNLGPTQLQDIALATTSSDHFIFQVVAATQTDPVSHLNTFRFDSISGSTTRVADLSETNGPIYSQLVTSEDGRCLFAYGAVFHNTTQRLGSIYVFAINNDGSLQPANAPLQVTHSDIGINENSVDSMQATRPGALLFTNMSGTVEHASNNDTTGGVLMASDGTMKTIPTIMATSCQACGTNVDDFVGGFKVTDDGKFAVVVGTRSGIHVFSLDGSGNSTEVSGSPFAAPPADGSDGGTSNENLVLVGTRFAYVTNGRGYTVHGFVLSDGGALVPISLGAPLATGAPATVSLSGKYLVVGRLDGIDCYLIHDDGTLELSSSLAAYPFYPIATVPGS